MRVTTVLGRLDGTPDLTLYNRIISLQKSLLFKTWANKLVWAFKRFQLFRTFGSLLPNHPIV